MEIQCPKCKSWNVDPLYEGGHELPFDCTCNDCGYNWQPATSFGDETGPETPNTDQ
jgi:hypothetical protein